MKLEYIDITQTHTHTHTHTLKYIKILKFPSTIFLILKSLYDSFIINAISYIFFNVHNQAIIKLLISHLFTIILPK